MNYEIYPTVQHMVATIEAWAVHPDPGFLALVYGAGFWGLIGWLCAFYLYQTGKATTDENRKYGSPQHPGETVSPPEQTQAH